MLLITGSLCRAGSERHPWQYPEVGVQRGRHHQALRRGHGCNGHLRHIRSRYIQRLCFTGCPNPPHLSKNKSNFQMLLQFCSNINPLSSTKRQPAQLRAEASAEMSNTTVPVSPTEVKATTSLLRDKVNIFSSQESVG